MFIDYRIIMEKHHGNNLSFILLRFLRLFPEML
jgi:hypothetical protein